MWITKLKERQIKPVISSLTPNNNPRELGYCGITPNESYHSGISFLVTYNEIAEFVAKLIKECNCRKRYLLPENNKYHKSVK